MSCRYFLGNKKSIVWRRAWQTDDLNGKFKGAAPEEGKFWLFTALHLPAGCQGAMSSISETPHWKHDSAVLGTSDRVHRCFWVEWAQGLVSLQCLDSLVFSFRLLQSLKKPLVGLE